MSYPTIERHGSLTRVEWPEASRPESPILLADAKRHARVTHATEDLLAADILAGAIEYAETATRRTIQLSRWDLVVDSFRCCRGTNFFPRRPPVVAVEEIAYRDPDGVWQTIDLETLSVDISGDLAWVGILTGLSWPTVSTLARSVRFRYRAGYRPHDFVETEGVATPPRIPPNLATAIKELFAWRFDNRGNLDVAVPVGIDSMFWSERVDL